MKIQEVLEKIQDPTKLIDFREIDELIFWVSSWISDYEEELGEIDYRVAVKEDELVELHGTNAKAKTKLKLEPVYINQQEKERRIRQLKAFKANLKRRYDILTNQFKY